MGLYVAELQEDGKVGTVHAFEAAPLRDGEKVYVPFPSSLVLVSGKTTTVVHARLVAFHVDADGTRTALTMREARSAMPTDASKLLRMSLFWHATGNVTDDAAGTPIATAGDGATFAFASHDTTTPLSHAMLTFASGTVIETGTHGGVQETRANVERGYPAPHPGTNLYALSSRDLFGPDNPTDTLILLSVADFLGAASHLFASPPGDLSLLQDVDWLAAGATTIGQFGRGNTSGEFTLTSVNVVSASPVPEPGTLALLSAGLLAVAGRIRRRR
jgi:hypothetical protein